MASFSSSDGGTTFTDTLDPIHCNAPYGCIRRYLKQDCEDILEHMRRFTAAIISNEPNAREDYEVFKNSKIAYNIEHVAVCSSAFSRVPVTSLHIQHGF